ncbi:MAG: tetratricopeptide repeat protein, partial [Gemmatimonadetes bacterium]|nr:tetratricopeptide repeat protein [Gemmatimonadota bacterium]
MKRILLAGALVLLSAELGYGQTCQAYINGSKARISKNKWADARKVLAENLDGCTDNSEYQYLYAVALARVSPDSSYKALGLLAIADSLNGNPGAGDELQDDIDQAKMALWGPMVNEGVRLLSAGDVEAAESTLRTAVEVNPTGKEGYLGLGAVHQTKKEYDLAIESFKQALEFDPAYKPALLRLGQTYQFKAEEAAAAGNVNQAERVAGEAATVYENYLVDNPDEIEVEIQLAGLHATLGNMEKAEPIIRRIMDSENASADVLTDFGFRLANAQQLELADEVLSRAVDMSNSQSTEPLSYLAFVRIQSGDLEGAKTVLARQIELEPDNHEAWEYMGYVRRDLGDPDGAMEAFSYAEAIPLKLESLRLSQRSDETWGVEATFSNRTEEPVQDLTVKFMLISSDGDVLEAKEMSVAGEALPAGEAENVTVQFSTPAE